MFWNFPVSILHNKNRTHQARCRFLMSPARCKSAQREQGEANKRMKQPRKKIIIGVMIPTIVALIVLKRTMGMPSMNGVEMVNIESLLITGMLLGMAVAQAISAFRKAS
jgi:hypothetical protein